MRFCNMTVKVVTDSTADLPPRLARELGITVVPAYVRFGDQVHRDQYSIVPSGEQTPSGWRNLVAISHQQLF